jgi:hypothetical protein
MVLNLIDKVLSTALGSSWRTSLFGMGAGVLNYFAMVGNKFPTTATEWKEAAFSAVLYAWGRYQKDQNVSNAPRPDEAKPVKP